MTIDAPIDLRPAAAPINGLLTSPILPTLLKLAIPNTIAMFGSTLVAVAETSYIGRLGTEPLAGIALVFPFVMLTQMMSAGAMGGGVSSAIGRGFGLGLFGLPKLGMRGVATGQLTAFTLGAVFLAWYLLSGRSRLKLNFAGFKFQRDMFVDILKVGAVSCLSPLQTVLTILIFTKILASFGTETLAGYGMGSRLEFLLTPIAFAFGVASVPMVGMAIGAGLPTRARRVAWTAGLAAGLTVGLIGLVVAIRPSLWVSLFTSDPGVNAAAYSYFALAGPAFGFFGVRACLYFAAQGAARVGGPVLAGTGRLLLGGVGGWWLVASGAAGWSLFGLVRGARR